MKPLVAASHCVVWLFSIGLNLGWANSSAQITPASLGGVAATVATSDQREHFTQRETAKSSLFTAPPSQSEKDGEKPIFLATQLTLSATWQEVRQRLAAEDSAAALAALDFLFARFSNEPELQSAHVELLPIYADLCLAHARASEAVVLYRQWLALPQTQLLLPQRIQIFNALANACEASDDKAGRIAALQNLIALAPPGDARKDFARLQLASLVGTTALDTIDLLRTLANETTFPQPLRAKARLQAIYLALQKGLLPEAADDLLAADWHIAHMPELAQLNFAAMRIGEYLLHQEQPEQALSAFALVAPQPRLLHLQQQRRADVNHALRQRIREQRAGSAQATAAVRFLGSQLAQIDHQLELLEQMPDTSASLLNARASALLLAGRPWHAAVLFHTAAEHPPADAELALHARYNRLFALQQAGRGQRLREEAEAFAHNNPHHPLARKARSLQAESLLNSRLYGEAVRLLTPLLQSSKAPPKQSAKLLPADPHLPAPDKHPSVAKPPLSASSASASPPPTLVQTKASASQVNDLIARLHFQRGYAYALLGNYDRARSDFITAATLASQPLLDWARYWSGQTDMLATDYSRAQTQLEYMLLTMDASHPAYAYARFSHAQALYATGDRPQAQAQLLSFLQTYPEHERAASAHLLLAETYIATDQVPDALALLRNIIAAAPESIRGQAVLRKGEVFEQLAQASEAIALYAAYLKTFTTIPADNSSPKSIFITGSSRLSHSAASTTTNLPLAHAHTTPTYAGSDNYARVAERILRLLRIQNETEQTLAILRTALTTYGNDPAMGDFATLLAHAFHLGLAPRSLGHRTQNRAYTRYRKDCHSAGYFHHRTGTL